MMMPFCDHPNVCQLWAPGGGVLGGGILAGFILLLIVDLTHRL